MKYRSIGAVGAAALIAASIHAVAAESITVRQANKEFAPDEITVQAGESVTFVNDDKVTHNVMSRTRGHKFNLGSQKPDEQTDHVFDKAGEVEVRCAIHPKMKMKVTVTN